MIGRLATFQVKADAVEEAIRITEKALQATEAHGFKGYRGYLSLVDRAAGAFTAVYLFDSEADLMAFMSDPLYRELSAPLAVLLTQPPSGQVYEVAAFGKLA